MAVERLAEDVPALVGIDHGFSFPLRYFEAHGLLPDWSLFLDDFQRYWPTDEDIYVDFVRRGPIGNGAARQGNAPAAADRGARGRRNRSFTSTCMDSVAKSTHAGIPWLRFIRQRLGARVHFWPFDGWDIIGYRRSLSGAVEPQFRARRPDRRPARCLQPSLPGCRAPIGMAASRVSSILFCLPPSRRRLRHALLMKSVETKGLTTLACFR
jgi:hypothetical protein